MKNHSNYQRIIEQRGAVAPIVAVCMVALIAVSALAVDIAHFYVARNELQNAADAGALAGAGSLLNADGTVNTNANTIAYNAATQNNSENSSVEVLNYSSNAGDVQRGHWTFASYEPDAGGSFAICDSTVKYNLIGKNYWVGGILPVLNDDPNFVNAVKVTARRNATPVVTFLAGIFGVNSVIMERSAVAFLGMAGSVKSVDEPVIICKESIVDNLGGYQCNMGRMINSGNGSTIRFNTAGWTDYTQGRSGCSGSAGGNDIKQAISCPAGTNQSPLKLGYYLASSGGQVESAFADLFTCWKATCDTDGDGLPDVPWILVLPVVECGDSNNVENCNKYVGVVEVSMLWMNKTTKMEDWVPVKMAAAGSYVAWVAPTPIVPGMNVQARREAQTANFNNFISHFNLKNSDFVQNGLAVYQQKAMYFLSNCVVNTSVGGTGGENYNIRAKNPVLVK